MVADRGFLDITILGGPRGVEAMLMRLETALAPPGLATWLEYGVEPIIQLRAKERFDTEGDDVTGQWLPLKPYTQMVRAQSGFPPDHPINVRTGELERYITQSDGDVQMYPGGASMNYPGTNPTGTLADKVSTAQVGSADGRTPARPVLGLNIHDLEAVLFSLASFIQVGRP